MTLGQSIAKSCRELQKSWTRLADSAFGNPLSAADETARGEFISPFISERGLNFPRSGGDTRQG